MFSPTVAPQVLERRRRAGEVDAGQVGVAERDLRDVEAVAGEHVDHARRQAGLLEQLHRQRRGELLGRRRLPDHRVAHQRRRGRQVAGDRGEVERRDRVDEALERAVVGAVPDAGAVRDRLLGEDLAGVVDVEPPEVDQLAGRVDLGLERGLRLAEHGGRVEPLPPRAGQQVGGLEQDRRARRRTAARASPGPRPAAALTAARASAWVEFFRTPSTCWWSCGWTTLISAPPPGSSCRPPMWRVRSYWLPLELLELHLEGGALGAARGVGQVRLVDGCRRLR